METASSYFDVDMIKEELNPENFRIFTIIRQQRIINQLSYTISVIEAYADMLDNNNRDTFVKFLQERQMLLKGIHMCRQQKPLSSYCSVD
jgi:flavodoxin